MLSTRSVCKAVTSAGGSGNALDESGYCAFGLEYCRKCYPKDRGGQYLRLDSGQARTTKKADVLALLDRNGGFPLPSGEPNLMVSTVRENFENRACEAVHFTCYQWWKQWKFDKAASDLNDAKTKEAKKKTARRKRR